MPVLISLLRGINVGGHAKIGMDALRKLCTSLGFEKPQTYIQSGNIVFKTSERELDVVAARLKQALEKKFACSPDVILRTIPEFRAVLAKNPFAKRTDVPPNKLLVFFLAANPARDARKNLPLLAIQPEELHLIDRHLYIHFPNGVGKSKLPWARVDKALGTRGTGRNWNSVLKILQIAESLESQP